LPLFGEIRKLLFLLFLLIIGSGCAKKEEDEVARPRTSAPPSDSVLSPAAPGLESLRDSLREEPPPEKPSLRIRVARGIVYASSTDSLSALAVETDDGAVVILIGNKAAELRPYQHQKMRLTGFWHPTNAEHDRDSLEVVDYELLRD